jgi:hypothetical protein
LTFFQKRLDLLEARKEAGLANNADIYQAKLDLNQQKTSAPNTAFNYQTKQSRLIAVHDSGTRFCNCD